MGRDGSADLERAAGDLARRLPDPLRPLARLAFNYRWSWMQGADELFREVDSDRFERCDGNPVAMLRYASLPALERAAADPSLARRAEDLLRQLDEDLARPPADAGIPPERPVAFFCAEFGIHTSLHQYSGGLGVLAGDILKEASDRALPMVGVGIMYSEGAYHQRLDTSGWQHDFWIDTDPDLLAAALVRRDDGEPITFTVPLRGREVLTQVWRVDVGRVPLYLLDTERRENPPADRFVTARLYVDDRRTRLSQYALLGVGGIRALRAMGIDPSVVHLNEGHPAVAPLELAREEVERGTPLEDALASARARTVFTTHTPVAAGNETYDDEEVLDVLEALPGALGVDPERILALGKARPEGSDDRFGMTTLALRSSRSANGVSARHGTVAREMWRPLYPDAASDDDVPIGHVTNGVHVPTWMADAMRELLARHLGADWDMRADDPSTWDGVDGIPDEELWEVRNRLRADLVRYVRERAALDRLSRGEPSDRVQEFQDAFVPEALTIGFARRVATYKRLYLLGRDMRRAVDLLGGDHPVQMVLAGKAHPQDSGAKVTLRRLLDFRGDMPPEVAARVAYLEDYDMRMGSHLVAGCDVWANLPRPPLEASGTSGMKAALNGALNLSVPDGWWEEAHDGSNGWIIVGDAWSDAEEQDANDARAFLDLIEREVVPLFFDRDESGIPRGWLRMVKASLRTAGARFGAGRMMDDYLQRYYRATVPAS